MTSEGSLSRVLFLAPYLGDGGINTHMLTLGTELRKLGWRVAICSGGPHVDPAHIGTTTGVAGSPVPDDYERAGIPHFDARVPASPHRLRELPQLLLIPIAMWHVIRAVRRFRPAIVHSHSRQMGLYARIAQLVSGTPFISTVHSPVTPRNRMWAATTFLGAKVIAVSEEIKGSLIRDYRAAAADVRVIAPAADPDRFRPATAEERLGARRAYGVEPEQFAVAFVGSMTANKHPETLVQAVAELTASGHHVVALVAGRGPMAEASRALAVEMGVEDRVRFLGYQDTRSVLWAADAFVLPSRSEGSPLVVVEAMLSGVVVVATPAGGAAQQVMPGVTGLLFEHGNHVDLASRIAQLVAEPLLGRALAARALEDARSRYSSASMARQVAETYVEVLRPGGR